MDRRSRRRIVAAGLATLVTAAVVGASSASAAPSPSGPVPVQDGTREFASGTGDIAEDSSMSVDTSPSGVSVRYDTATDRGRISWDTPREGSVVLTRADSTGRSDSTTQPASLGTYLFAAHASTATWVDYTVAGSGTAVTVRVDTSTGQVIGGTEPAIVTGVTVSYDTATDRGRVGWTTPREGSVVLSRTDSTGRTASTTQSASLGSYLFAAHASNATWVEYTLAASGEAVTVRVDPATGKVVGGTTTPPPAASEISWEPAAGWETHPVRSVPATPGQQTLLKGTGDVVLDLPDTVTGPIIIDGYRHVTIIGGSIRALPVSQINGIDQRLVYVRNVTGTVHIEGVLLDGGVAGAETDGITANGARTILQVQNVRVVGLDGLQSTNHADAIQTWLGLKELRVDEFTAESDYQGIKFALTNTHVMDKVTIRDTNLTATGTGARYLYWMDPDDLFPIELVNVWVDPYGTQTLGKTVWPGNTNLTNAAVISGGTACWPTMEKVAGCISEGQPPAGDFVPAGLAGAGYVSPGYN
ncbi:hypothetical protein O2W18_06615 [Modestobacter sp. VKM Ac-2983]|uniref:hypothetical protein n=1 Tax=Modestobacter sp. VKM Ac-2983 TaxID=3004137 RepID=UPI0022ABA9FC|nr:hypothetical protein [Modestobacter sp. VKM Ac-2983]MCZ2804763.1 hypothetical protein [Modestobacter sp. VKM Ac-2983]